MHSSIGKNSKAKGGGDAVRKKRISAVDATDDGRVIAPMNIEGMPWHLPRWPSRQAPTQTPHKTGFGADSSASGGGFGAGGGGSGNLSAGVGGSGFSGSAGVPEQMTRRESIAFAFGILKAVLLVAAALIGGYFAFIWFCVNIWFR